MERQGKAHTLLCAAEAGMPCTHRPCARTDIIEKLHRAVRKGLRTLAAKFIETVSFPVSFVSKLDRKTACVKVRTALAVLVDQPSISEFRPCLFIKFRELVKGHEMKDGR